MNKYTEKSAETIFTHKMLVTFTDSYKEMAGNTLN